MYLSKKHSAVTCVLVLYSDEVFMQILRFLSMYFHISVEIATKLNLHNAAITCNAIFKIMTFISVYFHFLDLSVLRK